MICKLASGHKALNAVLILPYIFLNLGVMSFDAHKVQVGGSQIGSEQHALETRRPWPRRKNETRLLRQTFYYVVRFIHISRTGLFIPRHTALYKP